MFLQHVEGCRGVIAVYMTYQHEYEEDGFHTVEEAESFLRSGEDRGSLSSVCVRLGDGTILRERTGEGLDRYRWP
jgi:hypothetical protein